MPIQKSLRILKKAFSLKNEIEDIITPYVLSVSDNGVGIPEDIDIENLDSLGLQLVTSLVEQLEGELELKRDSGTEFIIRFNIVGNNCHVSVPSNRTAISL